MIHCADRGNVRIAKKNRENNQFQLPISHISAMIKRIEISAKFEKAMLRRPKE